MSIKTVSRYIGHVQHSMPACLVFNPVMVEGYAALFSCTAVVQALDSMTASIDVKLEIVG